MTIQLQICGACGAHQYPPRDLCRKCLTDTLRFETDTGRGELRAQSVVHRTLDHAVAPELPLRIGSVALDAEVRIITFVAAGIDTGSRVELRAISGTDAHQIFIAEKVRENG